MIKLTQTQARFFELLQEITPFTVKGDGLILFHEIENQQKLAELLGFSTSTLNRYLNPNGVNAPSDRAYLKASKKLEAYLLKKNGQNKKVKITSSHTRYSRLEKLLVGLATVLLLTIILLSYTLLKNQKKYQETGLSWEGIKRVLLLDNNGYDLGGMVVNLNSNHVRTKQVEGFTRSDSIAVLKLAIEDLKFHLNRSRQVFDHDDFMTQANINIYQLIEIAFPSNSMMSCSPEEILEANIDGNIPPNASLFDRGLIWSKSFLFDRDMELISILEGVKKQVNGVQMLQIDSIKLVYDQIISNEHRIIAGE